MADNVETMFSSNGIVPWHRLGNVLDDRPNDADEALVAAGLDWNVNLRQLTYDTADGRKAVTDRVAVVRDNDNSCLGIVSPTYNPLQNAQMYKWVQNLLDINPGVWSWETGGSLQNGKIVWGMVNQGNSEIVSKDVVENNLLIMTSHNGTKPLCVLPTSIRVVCNNTLSSALYAGHNHQQHIKIKHNSKMEVRLEEAMEIYTSATEVFQAQTANMQKFMNVKMTSNKLEEFVEKFMPVDKKASAKMKDQQDVLKTFVVQGKASGAVEIGITNTLYGAVMGTGEFIEHYMFPRVKDRGNMIIFGQGAQATKKMFEVANTFMKAA